MLGYPSSSLSIQSLIRRYVAWRKSLSLSFRVANSTGVVSRSLNHVKFKILPLSSFSKNKFWYALIRFSHLSIISEYNSEHFFLKKWKVSAWYVENDFSIVMYSIPPFSNPSLCLSRVVRFVCSSSSNAFVNLFFSHFRIYKPTN